MQTVGSRFRWIACISALLLLCIVSTDQPMMGSGQSAVAHSGYTVGGDASDDAVIGSPENDIFTYPSRPIARVGGACLSLILLLSCLDK